MNRTILQVPVDGVLRREAEEQALSQGFSSLQEAVRIFLKKLAKGAIDVVFREEEVVQLSAKNARRYDKMIEDIRSGKVKTKAFTDVSSLMKDLNS
ncbi:MAG: hypothetical protein HW400_361 [Candidatus Levybacteria bacterium]|nr:hypothetical protein [Candidatus Levybacteria bacterium]